MGDFTHLHVHTEYSLLDGAARIKELFKSAKEKGMDAIAITDHGNLYGAVEFEEAAEKAGIKSIIGCEFYVCDDMTKREKQYDHLVLLAKNETGWLNLVKLDSLAFVDGFYYHPRIDYKLLREHTEGLVCMSACIAGTVPSAILDGDYDLAVKRAKELADMFAEGDFYIEVQDHGLMEEKRCMPKLVQLARECGYKIVATNDVHYVEKEDAEMHDVLLCVQTGSTLVDEKRMKFGTNEFYLKTYDEMMDLFSWCPDAISNTREIVDKCNCKVKVKRDLIPGYAPKNGMTPEQYIRHITMQGLERKYPNADASILERAEYELGIIHRMNFDEYFLIVWDYINYAKSIGIPVGPGRGSGVGSIVAYCMGITDVDPLRYSLLFERFLNPERVSMPDFDVDFCNEGRGEVINYVIDKYGADNVAQIITFGTMKAKNAIRDVGRVYGVSVGEVNNITKMIPNAPGVTLAGCFGELDKEDDEEKKIVPELVALYNSDDTARRVIDMARRVEGMPRNTSKHACGVIICKHSISDYVPLQKNGDDVTIQYVAHTAEDLGLLKMDFLGLITLTDIKKTMEYIKETTGEDIDFLKIGYDDKGVYDLLSSGETDAVFQLESAGMKNFMKRLKPNSLEDVIAGISLFRPGPMKYIDKYIQFKNNPETIAYDHPLLEEILKPTYGVMVYQEQVMQMVQKLGGYTLGRADLVRRAMGKKKMDVMAKEKKIFIEGLVEDGVRTVDGCINRGISEEVATKLFDDMTDFAKYAFNKSHAAAYAVLAYQTAYFKRYYPVQFMAAVLNNRIDKIDEITKYVTYLREHDIPIYPPDINKSDVRFTVEGNGVRFGLCALKGVGEEATKAIVEERREHGDYKSIEDLCDRMDGHILNKRIIESLIKAGAFDNFGHTRASMMQIYEYIMELTADAKKNRAGGQTTIFGGDWGIPDPIAKIKYPDAPEFEKKYKLALEKEVLGVYVTGHPLDGYENEYRNFNFNTSQLVKVESEDGGAEEYDYEASGIFNRMDVVTGGIISSIEHRLTKKGNDMCLAKLEDFGGSIELILGENAYRKHKHLLINDTIVKIYGSMMLKDDRKPTISVYRIEPWHIDSSAPKDEIVQAAEEVHKIYLNISTQDLYDEVIEVISKVKGNSPVYVQFEGRLLDTGLQVCYDGALMWELKGILGDKIVKIK